MDRDRYSGNCLFKVEAGNGEDQQIHARVSINASCYCVLLSMIDYFNKLILLPLN